MIFIVSKYRKFTDLTTIKLHRENDEVIVSFKECFSEKYLYADSIRMQEKSCKI